MDTHHCTNDDKANWKLEKREGKSGDSDVGCEKVASRRKVESLYKSHFYPPNINMVDGLMERLFYNQFGSPQKEALDLSKSRELIVPKEKHIPNCNATLTPSHHAISPVPSFGAVAEHANINQGGGVGKPLSPSEESGMDNGETGRETCSSQFLHKETPARPTGRTMSYECPTCSKWFANLGNLIVHIRTHTGERPYKCQLCSKSFVQLGHLQNHTRTHTGERPHQCQLCSKSFGRKQVLEKHIRSHTDERRLKLFRRPHHLNTHIQPAYIGERPYACQVCSKSFRQASHLKIHMRIHTGKGPNE